MRSLILVLIGLVLGAFGAHMVERTIQLRHAYPRAVMDVMQHHFVAMRNEAKSGTCPAATTQNHLKAMIGISHEIGPAFGTGDAHFNDLANRLRQSLQQSADNTPVDCKGLATALSVISGRCDDCHREYR